MRTGAASSGSSSAPRLGKFAGSGMKMSQFRKCSELNSILFNSLRVQLPTIKLLQSNLMERRCNNTILVVSVWAVVVAKLTEQSFPMQEVCVGTSVTRGLF